MRTWFFLACLLLAGCAKYDPSAAFDAAEQVQQARLDVAKLDLKKAEGDLTDAKEDLERLGGAGKQGAIPERSLIEVRRKVDDAEHNILVAKARVVELEALVKYARQTGRVAAPMRK